MENLLLDKKVWSSALNAFVIALVTQFVDAGADFTTLTGDALGTILNSAVTAAAWVIIRAVNPKDSKFGIGAAKPVVAKPVAAKPVKRASAKKK